LPTRINAYLLSSGGLHVFFGGEISKVALLEPHRADVALLPVNGLRVPLGPRLVMDPAQAIDGAKTLGAKVLVAIHDAHVNDPLYFMIRRRGSGKDAEALGLADPAAPEVVNVPPGQRRELVC
jgi:L-ascorbate metabolism protein UlaG (beta-lactamase superfamily)